MIKPAVVSPGEEVDVVGYIFDAPLVTKGVTWLPLTQLATWLIMVREAGRLHPERTWLQRMGVAALTMPVILGSEWCHNLAHAAAARLVGHPADAIRVTWGMPLLVYFDEKESEVTPRQHIIRALGGPAINIVFLGVAAILRRYTRPKSTARDVADAALGMNAFLILGGMLPIPYIDGGATLKWALVGNGQTPVEADETLKKVNAVTAAGLGAGAAVAFKVRKRFLGGIFAMFAATALMIATGLFREKE
jgi:Zn-dependent protease